MIHWKRYDENAYENLKKKIEDDEGWNLLKTDKKNQWKGLQKYILKAKDYCDNHENKKSPLKDTETEILPLFSFLLNKCSLLFKVTANKN